MSVTLGSPTHSPKSGFAGLSLVRLGIVPVGDVLPIPGAVPYPGEVAQVVSEQVIAADMKSKAIATLPRFRFIPIGELPSSICFISFIGVSFRFGFPVVTF